VLAFLAVRINVDPGQFVALASHASERAAQRQAPGSITSVTKRVFDSFARL